MKKILVLLTLTCTLYCSKDNEIYCPPGVEFACGCYPTPGGPTTHKAAFRNGGSCFYTDDNGTNRKIDDKYCKCL